MYYHGARYRDAKTGVWLSVDPYLANGNYFPVPPVNDKAKKANNKLPGMGGVFNSLNLNGYHYAGNNPIKYIDPDGNEDIVSVKTENPAYKKFESTFMVYKDGTLDKTAIMELAKLRAYKEARGQSITKTDVENILGKDYKEYKNFSTLPNDPQTQGTVAAGKLYNYNRHDFNSSSGTLLKAFLINDPNISGEHVPQDPLFNNGINPSSGLTTVHGAHVHTSRRGLMGNDPDYNSGSTACFTRYSSISYNEFFNDMISSPTGQHGKIIIFR